MDIVTVYKQWKEKVDTYAQSTKKDIHSEDDLSLSRNQLFSKSLLINHVSNKNPPIINAALTISLEF